MNIPDNPQWVCLQCGYNMIGEMPEVCPFCGARHDRFMAWDLAEKTYRVTTNKVNDVISQLLSVPKLGLEHAAYRVETGLNTIWIDSPSAFNRDLPPADAILFTHHHFMGASNQYRRLWNSEVWLHELDAKHSLAALFDIDRRFTEDFNVYGIEAYHVGGHTPGFTFYIFRDVLFICDYIFVTAAGFDFNPFGPQQETVTKARWIHQVVKSKPLKAVCGFNYVMSFVDWQPRFECLIRKRSEASMSTANKHQE